MTLLGLDLNATRVRAVGGPAGAGRPLALDGDSPELPLAISLEARHPAVGRPGAALRRRLPHAACAGFLPHLGTPQQWSAGRHRFDAARALSLIFDHLEPALQARGKVLRSRPGIVVAVPSYLGGAQLAALTALFDQARWSVLGSVTTPLASALAASLDQPWRGAAILADLDEHALTWTIVGEENGQAQVLGEQVLTHLNADVWKGRLLDAIADRCIRHSRRDPRESAVAEQMLYDQLDDVQDACLQDQMVEVVIQAAQWGQSLILHPTEVCAACAGLARQAVDEMLEVVASVPTRGLIGAIFFTAAAARLPGLLAEVEEQVGSRIVLSVLADDAVARAAHDLAGRFQRGELAPGHLDFTTPVAVAQEGILPLDPRQIRASGTGF